MKIFCVFICLFIIICILISIYSRAYSRCLLDVTITPNLLPCVLKRIFLLERVKNGVCLGSASKQITLFFEKCAPKNAPMHSLSRIGPVFVNEYR